MSAHVSISIRLQPESVGSFSFWLGESLPVAGKQRIAIEINEPKMQFVILHLISRHEAERDDLAAAKQRFSCYSEGWKRGKFCRMETHFRKPYFNHA